MEAEKALEIIQTLAEGIDPFSGEVFPQDSPYHNVHTVRALYKAAEALEKRKKREKPVPERTGEKWDKAEEQDLTVRFNQGITIPELAKQHQRTTGAIRSRLQKLDLIHWS